MDNEVSDIIQNDEWFEITESEIESVLEILSKSWPESLHVYNFIRESLDWSSKCEKTKTKVFCNKKWPGSVIATVKGSDYGVITFTPHKHYLGITSAFKGNDVVCWEKGPIIFCDIPLELCNQLKDQFVVSGRKFIENNEFDLFWIPLEATSTIEVICPEDMYFSKLEEIHATIVNSSWPYASERSLNMITDMIKFKDTVGLFRKKDSLLVSWVLNTFYGVGMLHTIKEYRRKGYGAIIVKKLIKILGKSGINPTLLALKNNFAAKSLFISIGFKKISTVKSIKVI